jgi:predicted nucleic acid-binding protein
LRYHLDTTFLIDWHRRDPRVLPLLEEVLDGLHEISVDPIIETEYFAAARIDRAKQFVFETALSLGASLPITSQVSRIAGTWLAPMDQPKRLAHFADSLIAATASAAGAVLVTGDRRIARVFPVAVFEY